MTRDARFMGFWRYCPFVTHIPTDSPFFHTHHIIYIIHIILINIMPNIIVGIIIDSATIARSVLVIIVSIRRLQQ